MGITASTKVIDFIKKKEGFRAKPYKDAKTGKMAVGYGDTLGEMKEITEFEANERLVNHLKSIESELSENIKVPMTQGQADVAIDMAYNMGIGKMGGFLETLNSGDYKATKEKILLYNKTSDGKGGKMVLPGLDERARERYAMWDEGDAPAPEVAANAPGTIAPPSDVEQAQTMLGTSGKSLASIEEEYMGKPGDIQSQKMASIEAEYFGETEQAETVRSNDPDLTAIAEIANPELALRNSEARRISKETNIPYEDAKIKLDGKTREQVLAEQSHSLIEKYHPAVAQWVGRDPENYVALRDAGPDYIRKVDYHARMLKKNKGQGNWSKVGSAAVMQNKKNFVHAALGLGLIPASDVDEWMAAIEEDHGDIEIEGRGAKESSKMLNRPGMEGFVDTFLKYPVDFMQQGLISGGSSAVMGLGTMWAGGTAGVVVAGLSALLGEYAGHVEEEMANFKDPATGRINYKEAASDPIRLAQWQKEGLVRGIVMGGSEALMAGLGGKFAEVGERLLMKTAIGKGLDKVAGSAAGKVAKGGFMFGMNAGEEAGSETVGSTTTDVMRDYAKDDKLDANIGDLLKKNFIEKGIPEAKGALVSGGAIQGSITATQIAVAKIMDTKKHVSEALNNREALKNLKKTMESSPEYEKHKESVNDLVDEATSQETPPPIPEEDEALVDNPEEAEAQESFNKSTAGITPSELKEELGDKYLDAVNLLPPAHRKAFMEAVDNDGSIEIPLRAWIELSQAHPGLEDIVRINGSKLNAKEAEEIMKTDPHELLQAAFHGTPHKFDKFSLEKIGTGEGAQAYGHGLYFAEDKDIAEYYRKTLTKNPQETPVFFSPVDPVFEQLDEVIAADPAGRKAVMDDWVDYLKDNGWKDSAIKEKWGDFSDPSIIKNALREIVSNRLGNRFNNMKDSYTSEELGGLPESAVNLLNARITEGKKAIVKEEGQLYEVEVPEKEQMLDWDKKFNEQSDYVKEKILAMSSPENQEWTIRNNPTGRQLYQMMVKEGRTQAEASAELKAAGVEGIKYLDGNSRRAQEGFQNFVVFDDSKIAIKKTFYDKNGDMPETSEMTTDGTPIEFIESTPEDPDAVAMRPIYLMAGVETETEKKITNRLVTKISEYMPNIPVEGIAGIIKIELKHMRMRASAIGVSLEEQNKRLEAIGSTDSAYGAFVHRRPEGYAKSAMPWRPSQFKMKAYKFLFSKDAMIKTIVHEFGHAWLHQMSEDYDILADIPENEMTAEQLAYWDAMKIVAKHLEVPTVQQIHWEGDWKSNTNHEKWAQTCERYFLEGKFANNSMKGVMDMIREYFIPIAEFVGTSYAKFKDTRGDFGPKGKEQSIGWFPINDEIERAMEGILGVSAAVEEIGSPMFQEPAFQDKKFLGENWEKYQAALIAARSEGQGTMYLKFHKQFHKEREKEINKILNKVVAEVTAEVDEMPSMKLLKIFDNAFKAFNANEGEDSRLSYESVLETVFNGDEKAFEAVRELIPRSAVKRKKKSGGGDALQVMAYAGIGDPIKFQQMLLEMGNRQQIIADKVNARIKEEVPVMKTEEELHNEAVAAMNGAGREAVLTFEFKTFMKQFPNEFKNVMVKLIKSPENFYKDQRKYFQEEAGKLISRAPHQGFTAIKFLNDYARLNSKTAKSVKGKDIQAAIDAKYNEIVHYHAYKEAIDTVKELTKVRGLEKQIKRYSAFKDYKKKYDNDILQFARQIVESVERGIALPILDRSTFSTHSGVTDEMIASMNDAVKNFSLLVVNTDPNTMTVGQRLNYGVMLSNILKNAEKAKDIEIGGQEMKFADAVAQAKSELKGGKVVSYESDGNLAAKVRTEVGTVRAIFDSMFEDSVAFGKSIFSSALNAITKGEADHGLELDAKLNKIGAKMRATFKKKGLAYKIVSPFVRDPNSKPILAPILANVKGSTFTRFNNKNQVLGAIMYMMSDSGSRKFLNGYGINQKAWDMQFQDFIDRGIITKEDMEFCQETVDQFADTYPRFKDKIRELEGREIGEVKAQSIKTPWGTFKGGYYPAAKKKEDMALSKESFKKDEENRFTIDGMYPFVNKDNTKERTEAEYEVDLDLEAIPRYLNTVLTIIHLEKPMRDFGRLMKAKPIAQYMATYRPGAVENVINPWFKAVSKQEHSEWSPGLFSRLARTLRHNTNLALYAFQYMSSVRQLNGLSVIVGKVGFKNTAIATKTLALRPIDTIKTILFNSPKMTARMQRRLGTSVRNQIKNFDELDTNYNWARDVKDFGTLLTFKPMQIAQNMVDLIGWYAAYEEGKSKGMDEDQAKTFADDMVEATQGSSAVSGQTNIQRGNEFKKLFTGTATTAPIAVTNLMRADIQRDAKAAKLAYLTLQNAVFVCMIPALFDAVVSEGLDFKDKKPADDEEEEEKKKNQKLMMKTGAGIMEAFFPIGLRSATSYMAFGEVNPSAPLSLLQRAKPAINAIRYKKDGLEDMSPEDIMNVGILATLLTGQPYTKMLAVYFQVEEHVLVPDDVKLDREAERIAMKQEIRELRLEEDAE